MQGVIEAGEVLGTKGNELRDNAIIARGTPLLGGDKGMGEVQRVHDRGQGSRMLRERVGSGEVPSSQLRKIEHLSMLGGSEMLELDSFELSNGVDRGAGIIKEVWQKAGSGVLTAAGDGKEMFESSPRKGGLGNKGSIGKRITNVDDIHGIVMARHGTQILTELREMQHKGVTVLI